MSYRTRPNEEWNVANEDGAIAWERVPIAVLMDIRRELRRLNGILSCPNFTGMPRVLRAVERNTRRPKRHRARKVR